MASIYLFLSTDFDSVSIIYFSVAYVANSLSCLKYLWLGVHVLFSYLLIHLPTSFLCTYLPIFLAMYMLRIATSLDFFKATDLFFLSFFDQIIQGFTTNNTENSETDV